MEHSKDHVQLKRLARAIARISGPRHQNQAIDHLNRIAATHAKVSFRKFFETYSADDSILTEPFSIVELNTELASKASKTLSEGDSDQRLMLLILFFGFHRNANEVRIWTEENSATLIPSLLVASHDENELVRRYSLNFSAQHSDPRVAARLMEVAEKETNSATARFARSAIDNIQGYCSDLPVKSLQRKWRFSDGVFPDNKPSFLPLAASDEQSEPAILEVVGTELRIGGACVGYLSQARSNPECRVHGT